MLSMQVRGLPWELVNMLIEFVSLGDPSRRMFDDGVGMTSTCFVLFWIVAVPASGPKDLFMEHVTM
jgi:hypothetical protein